MWTWVDGAEDIVVEGGFAIGDDVTWTVLTDNFDELLPQLPDDLQAEVGSLIASAVDDDGDDQVEGTVARIVMLTGRRRTAASDISATPAEHVQVLDMAGFLVELRPTT